tara:strand:+ start:4163 stop:5335 length:1173 start_codon:yes stop_codon:yes gene_type:complete
MRVNAFNFFLFVICFSFSLRYLDMFDSIPFLRYFIYTLPFLLTIFTLISTKNKNSIKFNFKIINQYFKIIIITSAFFCLLNLINNQINMRFISELIFISTPIILVKLLFDNSSLNLDFDKIIRNMFLFLCLIYFVNLNAGIFSIPGFILEILQTKFLVSKFDINFESGLSFVFGFFAIYFFTQKKNRLFLVAFFMTILAYKRIAILGVVVSILVYVFLRKILNKKSSPIIFTLLNIIIIICFYYLLNGYFDYIIKDYFGYSANYMLNGRLKLYSIVFDVDRYLFFGNGLGYIHTTLTSATDVQEHLKSVHSDVVKLYIEGGFFLLVFFIYRFYKISAHNMSAICLTVYLNILFLTDNIFIYVPELFTFYFLQSIVYFKFFKDKEIDVKEN